MPDKKISQLTNASLPLAGTEEVALVQGGQTLKATTQDIADLAGGGGGGIFISGGGTFSSIRDGVSNTASASYSAALGERANEKRG